MYVCVFFGHWECFWLRNNSLEERASHQGLALSSGSRRGCGRGRAGRRRRWRPWRWPRAGRGWAREGSKRPTGPRHGCTPSPKAWQVSRFNPVPRKQLRGNNNYQTFSLFFKFLHKMLDPTCSRESVCCGRVQVHQGSASRNWWLRVL